MKLMTIVITTQTFQSKENQVSLFSLIICTLPPLSLAIIIAVITIYAISNTSIAIPISLIGSALPPVIGFGALVNAHNIIRP